MTLLKALLSHHQTCHFFGLRNFLIRLLIKLQHPPWQRSRFTLTTIRLRREKERDIGQEYPTVDGKVEEKGIGRIQTIRG